MRLGNRALVFLLGIGGICGAWLPARADMVSLPGAESPRYYSVNIDTSSLAGYSGELTFQIYSPGFGYELPVTAEAVVRDFQTDAVAPSTWSGTGGVNDHLAADGGFEVIGGGTTDANYLGTAELEIDTTGYGEYISFDIEMLGATLNGVDPNSENYMTGFDLIMAANEPNLFGSGTVPIQVLNDPEGYGTFEYYASQEHQVTLEENDAVTVTPISGFPAAVPEPMTVGILGLGMAGALVRRRRR